MKRSRLKRANPERLAKRRAEQFGRRATWLMDKPCVVPGCPHPSGPPHHSKTRGAGGTKRDQVPICWSHHCEIHSLGKTSFERLYAINLTELAAYYCGLYTYAYPGVVQFGPTAEPGSSESGVVALPPSDPIPSPGVATGSAAAGTPLGGVV